MPQRLLTNALFILAPFILSILPFYPTSLGFSFRYNGGPTLISDQKADQLTNSTARTHLYTKWLLKTVW
jgi:hypothetical protein